MIFDVTAVFNYINNIYVHVHLQVILDNLTGPLEMVSV